MKKVLILSFLHLQPSAIGSVRAKGLAKYLGEFGWSPVILTAKCGPEELSDIPVISTDWDDIESRWRDRLGTLGEATVFHPSNFEYRPSRIRPFASFMRICRDTLAYPDLQKGWYSFALDRGAELIQEEGIDAIISSSKPETSHLVASELKRRFDVRWIADFRDLWTLNSHYHHNAVRKLVERKLESDTIRNADAIVTVSEPLADQLRLFHAGRPVTSIPNGYDPDEVNPGLPLRSEMTVTYTGSLYQGARNPELLLMAVRELLTEGLITSNTLRINFVGCEEQWLIDMIREHGLEELVVFCGTVPREQAINLQRRSHVLLLLTWNDPGAYSGKIYDYLAARRPILSIGPSQSVVRELILRTHSGVHVSSIQDVKSELLRFCTEFACTGTIGYSGIEKELDMHTHQVMAKRFAGLLSSQNI